MNAYVLAFLVVFSGTAFSLIGLLLVRRLSSFEQLRLSHDVSGYLISVVGALYAVLLGFVIVDAMQQYQHAKQVTEMETNTLADIFVIANRLHEPDRSNVRNACSRYIQQVIETEWDQMSCGRYCPMSREKAVDLMKQLVNFVPKGDVEKELYSTLLQESSSFWKNRQSRLLSAQYHLPFFEWVVLIAGAVIVMLFTFSFGLENIRLQLFMTGLLGMLISLNFALLLFFAFPFNRELGIKSDAFKSVSDVFDRRQ